MKTKKDILAWYFQRGKIVDNGDGEVNKDKSDFLAKIDSSLVLEEAPQDKGYSKFIITKPSWKFPVKLFFNPQGENYSILGF